MAVLSNTTSVPKDSESLVAFTSEKATVELASTVSVIVTTDASSSSKRRRSDKVTEQESVSHATLFTVSSVVTWMLWIKRRDTRYKVTSTCSFDDALLTFTARE